MHVKQNDNKTGRIASAYLRHSPFKPSNPADLPLSRLCTRDNTSFTETSIWIAQWFPYLSIG